MSETTRLRAERDAYKAALESIINDTVPIEDSLDDVKHGCRLALDGWNIKTAKRWKL